MKKYLFIVLLVVMCYVKAYSIITNGGFDVQPKLIKNQKLIKREKILDKDVSSKILPILRKIVFPLKENHVFLMFRCLRCSS